MTDSTGKHERARPGEDTTSPDSGGPARRPWVRPEIEDLPKLNDLTLDTFGDPVGGGPSVFA